MKPTERNKLIADIPAKQWGIELKNPRNIFFKKVEAVINHTTVTSLRSF